MERYVEAVTEGTATAVGAREDDFRPVKSAARVLEVLEVLATASGPLALRDVAGQLGVPKSSMHALLRTMQRRGWLETDATGTLYSLGLRSLLVGSAYVDSDIVVHRTAPVLDTLAERTGETVHLGRLEGGHVVYLAKRESAHPLRMFSSVGRRLPAHATALGKCLLAEMSDDEVTACLPTALAASTDNTITDLDRLLEDLDRGRQRGYAIDDEESASGLRCFAIALPRTTSTKDAISISVPIFRLADGRDVEVIRSLADARDSLAR